MISLRKTLNVYQMNKHIYRSKKIMTLFSLNLGRSLLPSKGKLKKNLIS